MPRAFQNDNLCAFRYVYACKGRDLLHTLAYHVFIDYAVRGKWSLQFFYRCRIVNIVSLPFFSKGSDYLVKIIFGSNNTLFTRADDSIGQTYGP